MKKSSKPSSYFLGYAVDIIAPTGIFFLLHRFGVPPLWGLLLGGVVAAATTAINTIRKRRIDRVGGLVIIEILVSIGLLMSTHDERFLLAKPSLYTGIAGVYLLATSFSGKPMTYEGVRQIGTSGEPMRALAFDQAWERSRAFRLALRMSSVGWGAAFLIDSVLRIVVVYRFPIDRAAWLSTIPHLVALMVLMAFSAMMGRRTKALVDDQMRGAPGVGGPAV